MNRRRALWAAPLLVVPLALGGCGDAGAEPGSDDVKVLASFYPLQYVAEQVGGEHVTVDNLTPPAAEPHDLELAPAQLRDIGLADVVVYLSGFQPAVDEGVETRAPELLVDAADVVTLEAHPGEHADEGDHEHTEGADDGHDHGALDPHFWLDPTLLAPVAQAVAAQLAELDPDGAAEFEANAAALASRLGDLDTAYEEGLATCERRVFVTSHTAFGYLADRYGLEEVGISGIDPDAEPSPARLVEIHDVVDREGVTTIFFEALVSPKVAQTLATDLGIESAVLDPLEGVSGSQTYFSVAEDNLEALQTALSCS